jgi:hypothetical protein
MKEVTNKQLFITMIIIGVITVGLLLPLYRGSVVPRYSYYNNNLSSGLLQANSYSAYSGDIVPNIKSSGVYIPVINTNYPVSAFRTSSTNTSYTTVYPSSTPTTKTYYYYSTNTNSQNYDTSSDQGYVPAGCEGGTDYSTTTNEPCG